MTSPARLAPRTTPAGERSGQWVDLRTVTVTLNVRLTIMFVSVQPLDWILWRV